MKRLKAMGGVLGVAIALGVGASYSVSYSQDGDPETPSPKPSEPAPGKSGEGDPAKTGEPDKDKEPKEDKDKDKDKEPKKHYVGSKSCKRCHLPQFRAWEKTPHATAFEALSPGKKAAEKRKAGLDPARDYRGDKKCVACHVVGLGHEGGFELGTHARPDAKVLMSVGCESCHGSGHALLEAGKKDRHYKAEHAKRLPGLVALGYVPKPDAKTCKGCHNPASPSFHPPFDFAKMKEKGVHKIEPPPRPGGGR
jgi:hypothetical protein